MTMHDLIQHMELQEAIVKHCLEMRRFIKQMESGETEAALATIDQALEEILSVSIRHCRENGWHGFCDRLQNNWEEDDET